ncbi:serine/arginine repetitive matrix protein 1-like [Sceloporus undulatus]|uniref:serine/arginine repetitive matrix protein 1-like n=1 Tax=Sceloporus undulatus TaxID=8520 RepID=UPI001C4D5E30|nr:serine/arginine repetitive matrix protein 1-like [Sceloporus undulatus]
MSPPFKKCDICSGKVPVQDPHSSCLFCLGKDHDPRVCSLCKSMSSQARKNRESRLTSAIAQGKIREGDPRPASAPSASAPTLQARSGPSSAPPSTSMGQDVGKTDSSRPPARGAASKAPKHSRTSGSIGQDTATGRREGAPSESSGTSRAAPDKKRSKSKSGSDSAPRSTVSAEPSASRGSTAATEDRATTEDRAGRAATISESPIQFFPPEAPPRHKSAKKRQSSAPEATASSSAKKPKPTPDISPSKRRADDASRPRKPHRESRRDRSRSGSPGRVDPLATPRVENRPSTVDLHHSPAEGRVRDTAAQAVPTQTQSATTLPFLLSDDEEVEDQPPRSPSPVSLAPRSPTHPQYYYDSETDQFFLPVPKEVVLSKPSRGRDRPRDLDQPRAQGYPHRESLDRPGPSSSAPSRRVDGPVERPRPYVAVDLPVSDSDPEPADSEYSSGDDDPAQNSPQLLHHPEAASPTDDVRSFLEHVIKMSRALDIDLQYPEEEARDPLERRVRSRAHSTPLVPFMPSLEALVRRSWDCPSSLVGPPRKIESLYKVSAPTAPWLTSHPRQNSAIVEGAQQTSTQRQAAVPFDKEAKKVDALARKAYAAAALAVKATNYTACMGAYIQTLMEGISPIVPDVPDEAQRTLTEIRDEAHSIGAWLITASRNVVECSGRAMAASIALRRHAWLRGSDLNSNVRSTIEDMPIDDSGLFHAETDDKLNRKFRLKAAARKHGPVVRNGRPQGRLLPHRNSGIPPEVPRLRRRLRCLPLQCASFRTRYSPTGLHEVHGSSGGLPAREGLQSLPLLRRLVVRRRIPARTSGGNCIRHPAAELSRIGDQQGKVPFHPVQTGEIHRSHSRLRKMLRLPSCRPLPVPGDIADTLHLPQKGESQRRPGRSGSHGVNDLRDTVVETSLTSTPGLVPVGLLPDGGFPIQVADGTETGGRLPQLVAGRPKCVRWDALSPTAITGDADYGCFLRRLGRPSPRPGCQGQVVGLGQPSPH